jgi:hypothetical protein
MDEKNLKQELESLKNELSMLKQTRFKFRALFKSASFVNGFIFSLIIIPLVTYAAFNVTNTFMGQTPISASAMNQNFDELEDKIDELNVGFVAEMSSNQTVMCDALSSAEEVFEFNSPFKTDGSFNVVTFAYQIPAAGYYRLIFKGPLLFGGKSTFKLFKNGIGTSVLLNSYTYNEEVLKLNAGDDIDIRASCFDKGGINPTIVIDSTKSFFGITPL